MKDIEILNKKLADIYGTDLQGHARFRIVWSMDAIEKVFGKFNEFYGHIFLREVIGVRERKKYPKGTWGETWILEIHGDGSGPPEVVDWDGYEPCWSFRNDITNEVMRPTWRTVNLLVQTILYGPKKTLSERWDEEELAFSKEVTEIREMLEDDLPFKVLQLKHGEGIVVPKNYERQE